MNFRGDVQSEDTEVYILCVTIVWETTTAVRHSDTEVAPS